MKNITDLIQFKKSMFITSHELEDGSAILFSPETKFGSLVLLESTEYNLWKQNRLEELVKWEKDNLGTDNLLRQRFIINADENQIETLKKLRLESAFDKEPDSINFTISLTTFCNARCEYCFQKGLIHTRLNPTVANGIVEFIKKTATTYNAKKVYITWFGGEPLLEPHIIEDMSNELIMHFKDNYNACMITNGSLINDKVIAMFKRCHISEIQITLDGIDKKYEKIKNYYNKNYTYSTILRNIENCLRNNILVIIRLNVSKNNKDEILNVIDELDKKFGSFKSQNLFFISVSIVTGEKTDCSLFTVESQELKDILSKIYEKLYILRYTSFDLGINYTICDAYRYHSYFFDPDGDIYRCDRLIGKKEKSVGNVFTGLTISEEDLCTLLKEPLPEKCNSCKMLPMCQGGCKDLKNSNIGRCRIEKFIIDELIDIIYKHS